MIGSCGTGKSLASQPGEMIQADTLKLDLGSSLVYWRGTDMGGMHEGTIRFQEGKIQTENNRATDGYFEVDMHTIEVTDIPAEEVQARRYLREHLESEDFFLVEEFPVSSLKITEVEYLHEDSLMISADLTIRNVTKNITFAARQYQVDNSSVSFETAFVIDRFEWNVAYQGSFWKRLTSIIDNNLVHADIQLRVKLNFQENENAL